MRCTRYPLSVRYRTNSYYEYKKRKKKRLALRPFSKTCGGPGPPIKESNIELDAPIASLSFFFFLPGLLVFLLFAGVSGVCYHQRCSRNGGGGGDPSACLGRGAGASREGDEDGVRLSSIEVLEEEDDEEEERKARAGNLNRCEE